MSNNAKTLLGIIVEGIREGKTAREVNDNIRLTSCGRYSLGIHDRYSSPTYSGPIKTKTSKLRHKDENDRTTVNFQGYQIPLSDFREAMRTMSKLEVTVCDYCKIQIAPGVKHTALMNDGTKKDACSYSHAIFLTSEDKKKISQVFVLVSKHGEWAGVFSTKQRAEAAITGRGPYIRLGEYTISNVRREIWQRPDGHQYYIYPLEVK